MIKITKIEENGMVTAQIENKELYKKIKSTKIFFTRDTTLEVRCTRSYFEMVLGVKFPEGTPNEKMKQRVKVS